MNFTIVETNQQNNAIFANSKNWNPANKFLSKNKVINKKGQLTLDTYGQKYIVKEKWERHFTPFELLKRRLLAITLTAGTFGILGLSNRVKSLYCQKKETVRLVIPAKSCEVKKSIKRFSKLIIPEKSLENLSSAFKAAIQNRNHQTIRLIQNRSFKIQQLYFFLNYNFDENKKMMRILNNSLPDLTLTGLIQNLHSYKKSCPMKDLEAIELLIEKFQKANIIATMAVSIIHTPSQIRKELFRQELCTYLMQKVASLKNQEELLIPAGYFVGDIFDPTSVFLDTTYGHAILVSIKKEHNIFSAAIFNTGFGSKKHSTINQAILLPIIYDLGSFSQKEQKIFFDKLTSLMYRPANDKASSKENVTEKFYTLFKKYVKIEASKHLSYEPQKIANCTHQCLVAYLSARFPSSEANHSFRFTNFAIHAIQKLRDDLQSYLQSGKTHSSYKHPLFPKKIKDTPFLERLQLKLMLQFSGLQISEHKKTMRFTISEPMLHALKSEADSKLIELDWFQKNVCNKNEEKTK